MKKMQLFWLLFFVKVGVAIAQINPVQNLNWEHFYQYPNNYFNLSWDEPQAPHNDLIGYNIYREDELYRFQTEPGLYNLPDGANCDLDFINYGIPGEGFYVYVMAVYEPDQTESEPAQVFVENDLYISTEEYYNNQVLFYPNPTENILNIKHQNLDKITIFDVAGKIIKEFVPQSQISLSDIDKGLYIIQFTSKTSVFTSKILIK